MLTLPALRTAGATAGSIRGGRDVETRQWAGLQKHIAHLEALYRLYERMVAYHGQLTAFFRQLRQGAYIQATIESMLLVRAQWPRKWPGRMYDPDASSSAGGMLQIQQSAATPNAPFARLETGVCASHRRVQRGGS